MYWQHMNSCHHRPMWMHIYNQNPTKRLLNHNLTLLNMSKSYQHIKMDKSFYSVDWLELESLKRKLPLLSMSMVKDSLKDSNNVILYFIKIWKISTKKKISNKKLKVKKTKLINKLKNNNKIIKNLNLKQIKLSHKKQNKLIHKKHNNLIIKKENKIS